MFLKRLFIIRKSSLRIIIKSKILVLVFIEKNKAKLIPQMKWLINDAIAVPKRRKLEQATDSTIY